MCRSVLVMRRRMAKTNASQPRPAAFAGADGGPSRYQSSPVKLVDTSRWRRCTRHRGPASTARRKSPAADEEAAVRQARRLPPRRHTPAYESELLLMRPEDERRAAEERPDAAESERLESRHPTAAAGHSSRCTSAVASSSRGAVSMAISTLMTAWSERGQHHRDEPATGSDGCLARTSAKRFVERQSLRQANPEQR